jgi:hypothetical protein
MMGGEEELVAIRPPNGSVVRLAKLGRALADGVEHGLNVDPRACDDAKDLACRPLLLLRFVQVAAKPRDLCFLASRGTATDRCLWRVAALSHCCLTASRFNWFATCSGAPSHCLPQGSGQGIVDCQSSTLEVAGCGFGHRSLNGRPRSSDLRAKAGVSAAI